MSDRSFIQTIVQDRDTETLERQGVYYLIFKSAAATAEYQKRAIRISKLLDFHGPPTMISERPTPPDLDLKGEDVRELIRSYTLSTYKSPLRLYQPRGEMPDALAAIVECGGLPHVVNRPGRMPAEVAVRFPMSPMTMEEWEAAVAESEVARNLPWVSSSFSAFRCQEYRRPGPRGARRRDRSKQSPREDVSSGTEFQNEVSDGDEIVDTPRKQSTIIMGFDTPAEAEAFVRYWHRRVVPSSDRRERSKPPIIVEADVL